MTKRSKSDTGKHATRYGAQVWCLVFVLGLGGAACGRDNLPQMTPSPADPQPPPAIYVLTTSAQTVAAGTPLSVSWSAPGTYPPGREDGHADWIGFFKVGEPSTSHDEPWSWWSYTQGDPAGTLNLTAPAQPTAYEFRYFLNDGYFEVARSSPVTVTLE